MAPPNREVTTSDGRVISYDRWRYEETIKQERIMAQVNVLAMEQASSAVSVGNTLGQQEYGGLLRVVLPNIIDQYGKVNATAAVKFYDQLELNWYQANPDASRTANRGNVRRQARRYAQARTKSAIALAQMDATAFAAKFAEDYKLAEKSERVIGWAMKIRARDGHEASVVAMNNALTREVASYHRDTILFNAALDENVSRVQRVAQANACAFCRMMALGSTDGKVRTSTYAAKFHDHCHCTIQPLFAGEEPVRPDYYDEFEKQYKQARMDSGDGSADDIVRQMRKADAARTPLETPKIPSQQTVQVEPPKPLNVPYTAEQVGLRTISPDAPADRSGWWWTKEYETGKNRQDLIREFNREAIYLQKSGPVDPESAYKVARTLELSQVRENLPVLPKGPDLVLDAVEKTNPKYNPNSSAYSSNCARVVQAYELRRRGFDVSASKYVARDGSQAHLFYGQYWKNPKTGMTMFQELEDRGTKLADGTWSKRTYTGKTTYDDFLQRIADTYPPDSRGVIQVQWSKGKLGHIFNFEVKKNGSVLLVDAQTGKIGSQLTDYFDRGVLWKTARLDDKNPMAGVLQYLQGFGR